VAGGSCVGFSDSANNCVFAACFATGSGV
jgi:hypothetical protein